MKDRLGCPVSGGGDAGGHPQTSDAEIQRMVDLVSRTNILNGDDDVSCHPGGPVTGPAQVEGENIFDTAFGGRHRSASPISYTSERQTKKERNYDADSNQLLNPSRAMSQGQDPKSAPLSRRVSLKRTYTDSGSSGVQNRLMDALAQPYSASGVLSPGGLSSSGAGGGRTATSASAVHTHSSKWSGVPQAVFRTEATPRWTILATNDLACLVFGITQKEFRKLSILDLIQEERRPWLESRLKDSPAEATTRNQSPEKPKPSPRLQGMGNGVTAQLLNKPPAREKLGRRAQTGDGYDRSRRANSPYHPPTKSRGVLLCGDVIPIQRRNGSTGSASVWVMEKRGGLIWVVEEITENVAQLELDAQGHVVESKGDTEKIWGKNAFAQPVSVFDLLPHIPESVSPSVPGPDLSKIAEQRYFIARTSSGVDIPVTGQTSSNHNELRVSSFPHIAGMMVICSKSLDVISANPVFSASLFGRDHPEGCKVTELIPNFDAFLQVLTEEDNVPLVDGTVLPEHSFRRARALSILRGDEVNLAALFSQPTGLPARHRDGGEIMVDVQMRVAKSVSCLSKDQMPTLGENEELESNNENDVAATEDVFALWITYSRQLHAGNQGAAGQMSERKFESQTPLQEQSDGNPSPTLQTPRPRDSAHSENNPHLSLLTQELNEAASEPLTDEPAQPMPEVNIPGAKKDAALTKKTISDYVILEDMGQGAYGQVKLVRSKRDPTKKVVLKYVTKKRILVDTWTRDRRLGTVPLEIHVLDYLSREHLRHPNIVEMEGFFEDDINYYIEMTPHGLPGMDLFDYVELRSTMTEAECRNIFRQVVDAIHHLHTNAMVVHRDIKDENVVLDGEGRIKLIDFGSAAYIKNGPFDVFVGTIGKRSRRRYVLQQLTSVLIPVYSIDYAAPEVLQGKPYRGKEQDVWALGILLYTIIYKENPFYNINEIMDHPLRVPFLPFSEDCLDLIRRMLNREVDERLPITEVMAHPWMQSTANGASHDG